MLEYVTLAWNQNFVTVDLDNAPVLETFMKRPWFMLVSVDAPIMQRFRRSAIRCVLSLCDTMLVRNDNTSLYEGSLEDFVRDHDALLYGSEELYGHDKDAYALDNMMKLSTLHIVNSFDTTATLYSHLDDVDLLNGDRLRPSWDTYFMVSARQINDMGYNNINIIISRN